MRTRARARSPRARPASRARARGARRSPDRRARRPCSVQLISGARLRRRDAGCPHHAELLEPVDAAGHRPDRRPGATRRACCGDSVFPARRSVTGCRRRRPGTSVLGGGFGGSAPGCCRADVRRARADHRHRLDVLEVRLDRGPLGGESVEAIDDRKVPHRTYRDSVLRPEVRHASDARAPRVRSPVESSVGAAGRRRRPTPPAVRRRRTHYHLAQDERFEVALGRT